MGVEVITHLDVIKIGKTKNGRPVYFDKTAYESDMTIVINRVKPHKGTMNFNIKQRCNFDKFFETYKLILRRSRKY
ncbi:MAG: DUF2088 domain-containing protein [Chloroflexi bacterium]|jgi:hypothetical protein|nr:DUF2088 domain-containing protein [Chloroflexota bacterium]MBT5972591.1 DUF2088 domain-containing protein [Desulfobacula sp.]